MRGVLPGISVTLRLLRKKYFHDYLVMFSPLVRSFLHIESLKTEKSYLNERIKNKTCFYCIFDNASKNLIGGIEIADDCQAHGQLYGWVNEQFWGGGRYQEALALIAQEYFSERATNFLDARVDIANKRSYSALKKFGFADVDICNGPYGRQYVLLLRKKRVA